MEHYSSNLRVSQFATILTSTVGTAVTDSYIYMAYCSNNTSSIEDWDFNNLN